MKSWYFLFVLILIFISCYNDEDVNKADISYDQLKNEIVNTKSKDSIQLYWNSIEIFTEQLQLSSDLSIYYKKQRDSTNFYLWNSRFLDLSLINGNSIETAEAYWDRATFNYTRNNYDSSYYYYIKASDVFYEMNDTLHTAAMLYSAGIMQMNLRDYLGGEVTTIRALEFYDQLGSDYGFYKCYNTLGVIHNSLQNFDNSLHYHSLALEYAQKLSDSGYISSSHNNISVLYQKNNEYNESIEFANKGLDWDSLIHKDIELYARLIDNLAYSKFKLKVNDSSVFDLLEEARSIRDSIDDESGLSVSNIHLAEYYIEQKESAIAKKILKDELIHAKKNSSATDLIDALDLLGQIDPENSQKYLQRRIAISDSLIDIERKTQNKFARTQYETDKVIATNQELTSEKKIIILVSAVGLLVISLIYFIIVQRTRVRKLRLEQAQVKANEDIYKLLIAQQNSLEEGRRLEKNRMSKELHDSVLGKLFGIRFLLSSLNSLSGQETEEQREKYLKDLEETEEEIRQISHDLQDRNEVFQSSFYQIVQNFLEDQNNIYSFKIDLHIETGTFDLDRIPISH